MRLLLQALRVGLVLLVAAAATVFVLMQFFGLRAEFAGTGITPIFTFYDPESHYDEIESERAPAAPAVVEAASRIPDDPNAYWTDYRGPRRDGVHSRIQIRTDWPRGGLPEVWRTKVGGGYASVVAAQGLVFTIEQRRDREVVAAYDIRNGKQAWETGWDAFFQEAMGGDGPRATPSWSAGKLYALGAAGELRCLEAATGKTLWRTNILADADASNVTWGMSGAPLVAGGKVFVHPGGGGKAVAAYDAATGDIVWQSQTEKAGYASPDLVTLAGQDQLLVFGGSRLLSLDPNDGSLLWEYPWQTSYDINSAQPIVVDQERVFISSGYGHGAALLKITPASGRFQVETIWEKNTMKNKFNSSVLYEGYVYGLDESILACVDVMTGERAWKGGRYGFGQLLLADGHLIVLTEQGDVVLVKATPESHQELVRFSALSGKTWNNPAIADGKLIVRNQTEMAAYQLAE